MIIGIKIDLPADVGHIEALRRPPGLPSCATAGLMALLRLTDVLALSVDDHPRVTILE